MSCSAKEFQWVFLHLQTLSHQVLAANMVQVTHQICFLVFLRGNKFIKLTFQVR